MESIADAHKLADLFKAHRGEIDGILITLPNFGDERAIANTIRWAGLDVPVLLHAFNDEPARMSIADRRDSFCGKMSAANNLRQYGIKFTLTSLHTVDPTAESFRADLRAFAATCRVVGGLRGARIGALGARPTNFNTVRYSEKLLEMAGISVETLDLSEAFGRVQRMPDSDAAFKAKYDAIVNYIPTKGIPQESLVKISIATHLGGPIAVIDTEHGSASKYADLFDFDVAEMHAPYHPDKYLRAIKEAADAGYKVIILDSMSHAWNGDGKNAAEAMPLVCLLYTSPSPRDRTRSRMPSSA